MSESCKDGECSRHKAFGILATIDEDELKSIHIAIRRKNIPNKGSLSPLRRDLDNPESLRIHLNGKKSRRIFDQSGVLVNKVILEEFATLLNVRRRSRSASSSSSDANYEKHKRSSNTEYGPSKSHSHERIEYKTKSRDDSETNYPSTSKDYRLREEHYSPEYRSTKRNRSRSSSNERNKYVAHKCSCSKRKSKSPEPKKRNKSPPHSPKYHSDYHYHRSKSPHYRKLRSPDRDYSRRYSRSRTPPLRPGEYKPPRRKSRERSKSPPLRPGEYRPPRRSRSKEYEERTRSTHSRSRSSRSPSRSERYRSHSNRYDMRHSDYEMYENPNYAPIFRPPLMPRFLPRGMRPEMFVPVQYIPYPAMPVRPPLIRPPKIYNNRTIPNLVSSTITSTGSSANTTASDPAVDNNVSQDSDKTNPKD